MEESDRLAARFEAQREHLRAIAYRMLGSPGDAEDAVQETWLRLHRAPVDEVGNLAGWLTTVLARVCLDMLRARRARRDEPVGRHGPEPASDHRVDPEYQAVLTDSVSRALVVVLERLSPAERVAFVLHDMFAVPFDQVAPVVGRSPDAAKKLASRARQRVRGAAATPDGDVARHREVVETFLAAARGRDVTALLALLAPDVVRRADPAVLPPGAPAEIRGADEVARNTILFSRVARTGEVALVDGAPGVVVVTRGRLFLVIAVEVIDGMITSYDVIADRHRLDHLELAVLD